MTDNYTNAAADAHASSQEVPLFSIVIPIYNVEKWLRLCLESVLNQTYKEYYEVVLVDDGSPDSCPAICDEYKEKYPEKIKVIHQENKGLLRARCAGYTAARGRYMVSVDSDDIVSPYLLEKVTGAIKDTGADLILYSFERIDTDNHVIAGSRYVTPYAAGWIDKEDLFRKWVNHDIVFGTMWLKVFVKDLYNFKKFGENRRFRNGGEDFFQSIDIMANAKCIYYLDEILYYWRYNLASVTHSFSWELFLSFEEKNEWWEHLRERAAGLGVELPEEDTSETKKYGGFLYGLWSNIAMLIKSPRTHSEKAETLDKMRVQELSIKAKEYIDTCVPSIHRRIGLKIFYSGHNELLIAYETLVWTLKKAWICITARRRN